MEFHYCILKDLCIRVWDEVLLLHPAVCQTFQDPLSLLTKAAILSVECIHSQFSARHISLHISMFHYCRASNSRQDRTLISINNKYQQRMWLTCLKTASLWAKNPIWPTAREASQWPSLFVECAKSQASWNVHSLEPRHNTTLAMFTL